MGHLYAAEALVVLDQTTEALQHLSQDLIPNNDEQQTSKAGCYGDKLWDIIILLLLFIVDDVNSQAMLLMNIATVYCIRQDMEKARKALQQVCASIQRNGAVYAKAVLLSAYIELHTGKIIIIITEWLILLLLLQVMSLELYNC